MTDCIEPILFFGKYGTCDKSTKGELLYIQVGAGADVFRRISPVFNVTCFEVMFVLI